MARRLTDQQRRRIAHHHARRRDDAGSVAMPDEQALEPEQEARVVARYGSQLAVETLLPPLREVRCFLRANLESLVAGDRVIVRLPQDHTADAGGVVVASCPRNTVLMRPDSRGLLRPVAANIDTMLVTIAPKPEPFPFQIDRYLVAADCHGIEAAIVCNKIDLPEDTERAALRHLLAVYRAIGYPVFEISSHTGSGLPALLAYLQNRTAVVVGQSGVGKSSLVSALLPDVAIRVGDLSAAVDKGKHTTTTARLYHLPQGGSLIDSPGIREFTLPPLPAQDLLSHFVDLREHAHDCRFRDCRHQQEPGCALLDAEAEGKVFPERMASYRNILASLA